MVILSIFVHCLSHYGLHEGSFITSFPFQKQISPVLSKNIGILILFVYMTL